MSIPKSKRHNHYTHSEDLGLDGCSKGIISLLADLFSTLQTFSGPSYLSFESPWWRAGSGHLADHAGSSHSKQPVD
jgi:hypothetical protein